MSKLARWYAMLALASAASADAQQLLTTDDGVSLRGTVRLLQGNAATCNVNEENEQDRYEELRVNQGQPLHLWELEFSVYNGSGRDLDHLVAYYGIESPWPPCTNWTERYELEGDYVYIPVQWTSTSGNIQQSGAGMPTRPGQTHSETILLLAFNGVRPQFSDWSVNYTFFDASATPAVAVATAPAVASPPSGAAPELPFGVTADSVCAENPEGESCWMELENLPGCYIWNPNPQQSETVTWSGQCSEELLNGTGTVTWVSGANGERTQTNGPGLFVNGKMHGHWVLNFDNGNIAEGSYIEGLREGRWIERGLAGDVWETPYVNGEPHGTQVWRDPLCQHR